MGWWLIVYSISGLLCLIVTMYINDSIGWKKITDGMNLLKPIINSWKPIINPYISIINILRKGK